MHHLPTVMFPAMRLLQPQYPTWMLIAICDRQRRRQALRSGEAPCPAATNWRSTSSCNSTTCGKLEGGPRGTEGLARGRSLRQEHGQGSVWAMPTWRWSNRNDR